MANGQEIAHLTHNDIVWAVAFCSDGKYVVSGSGDKTARIWYWRPEDLIALACENLPRAEWQQLIGKFLPYQVTCPNLPIEPEPTARPKP